MDKGEVNVMEKPSSPSAPPVYTAGAMMNQPVAAVGSAPQPTFAVAVQDDLPKHLHPHNFMVFSILTATFCGVFNILTLVFTIPAIVMSVVSSTSSTKGVYNRGKSFGNVAAGLSVMAILFGMVFAFSAVLINTYWWTYLFYCGIGTRQEPCDQNIAGRPVN